MVPSLQGKYVPEDRYKYFHYMLLYHLPHMQYLDVHTIFIP